MQRTLLRADLNVPMNNGTIVDDFRLQAIRPTIDKLLGKHRKIILITHIGRPKNHNAELSTRHLIPWFEQHGYTIEFVQDLAQAYNKSRQENNTIVLLENLRFFPGEQHQDRAFAQQLADLADEYVLDAFATLHRHDTSITLVPTLFTPGHRHLGPLIQQEQRKLNHLIDTPGKPYLAILGGGKVTTKIPLIESLLDKATEILLCPALVFTFLKAQGIPVGTSLIDDEAIDIVKTIATKAANSSTRLLYPLDYQVARGSLDGPLEIVSADAIPADGIGMSVGPQTIAMMQPRIAAARTIFYNAAMGFAHRPATLDGSEQLLKLVAQSTAYSVVGGGDSVGLVRRFGLEDAMSYLSTGGGATINYIAGEPLPGLKNFS